MKRGWVRIGIAVACIFALSWFLRVHDLGSYPPGLFPDEAANGEDSLLILHGDTRPFYPRNNGREALFFYIEAASLKTFGIGPWQMHLAPAIIGAFSVLAIYFATSAYFGRLAGLFSSLFLATSSWHLALSRTSFRAILIPLVLALFTAFVGFTIRAVKDRKIGASYWYGALAGLSFASGFYTYIAYRAMPAVVLGVLVLLLLAALHPKIGFPHVRRYGKQTVLAILVAVVAMLPLALYFSRHVDEFLGRAGQVSVFNKDLQREVGGGTLVGTLLYSFDTTVLSFFTHGDTNWRHNVSGYPLLNPLVGLLFIVGFMWAIRGTWNVFTSMARGKEIHLGMVYPYLILLLFGMMLPSITTAEGMPHALRSIGMIVPMYILAGAAAAVASRYLVSWAAKKKLTGVAYGIIAGLAIVFSAYGPLLYFTISRNSPDAAQAYRGDLTVVSDFIRAHRQSHPQDAAPYLVLDGFSEMTVHFLTSSLSGNLDMYTRLEPAESDTTLVRPGEVIMFTQSTIPDADRYEKKYHASLTLIESKKNKFGQEVLRVYEGKGNGGSKEEFDLDA